MKVYVIAFDWAKRDECIIGLYGKLEEAVAMGKKLEDFDPDIIEWELDKPYKWEKIL